MRRMVTTAATGAFLALVAGQAVGAAPALAATAHSTTRAAHAATAAHTTATAAQRRAAAFTALATDVTRHASVRIAAGSSRPVRQNGVTWSADRGTAGGSSLTLSGATSALTAHARSGSRSYGVTVPKPGAYRVELVLPATAKRSAIRLTVNGTSVTAPAPVRQGVGMATIFTARTAGRRLTFRAVRGALVVSGIAVATAIPVTSAATPSAAPTTAGAPTSAGLPGLPTALPTALPTSLPTSLPGLAGAHWASGVYPGGSIDTAAAQAFADYRGSKLDVATLYTDWSSWSQMAYSTWYLDQYQGFAGMLSIGVPLVAPNGGTLADVAAGTDDTYFTSWAQNLVAAGRGLSYVRLGWEFDGSWVPWAANNASDYIAAFRHVVGVIRATDPAAIIVWNGTLGESHVGHNPFTELYPGDDVVNVVGVDAYDTQYHHVTDDASMSAYENTVNGLNAWLSFAKAHGKLFAVPEWGLDDRDGTGAEDNAGYISEMHSFFAANASSLAFECYFNENMDYIQSALEGPDQNPQASAVYASLWSQQD